MPMPPGGALSATNWMLGKGRSRSSLLRVRERPVEKSVVFVSLMNMLDRTNAQRYTYNADYSRRTIASSLFERSVYFGATITWLKENR